MYITTERKAWRFYWKWTHTATWVVKSSGCSSRGPRFDSQHSHTTDCDSGYRGSTALFWSPAALHAYGAHGFTCRKCTHTHEIKGKCIIKIIVRMEPEFKNGTEFDKAVFKKGSRTSPCQIIHSMTHAQKYSKAHRLVQLTVWKLINDWEIVKKWTSEVDL